MDWKTIVRRPAERKGFCRGCDNTIERGDEMIYTYSIRNRGQKILFCLDCAEIIGELAKEKSDA